MRNPLRAVAGRIFFCFGVILMVLALSCSDDSSGPTQTNGLKEGDAVPDFALLDVNPYSVTESLYVGLSDYPGQIVMVFFGAAYCDICKPTFDGIGEIIDSLLVDGITGVRGLMINPWSGHDAFSIAQLTLLKTGLPVLQDTLDAEDDAVAALLDCEPGADALLVVDRTHHLWKKTSAGAKTGLYPAELDLRTAQDRELVRQWIHQLEAAR